MYTIKQASQETGMSEDTLRYYEKVGLLPRVERLANGHRAYRQEDLAKLRLIHCLKKTKLPLEEMKPYLNLPADGVGERYPELVDMMQAHRERVRRQMAELQQVLDFIDARMAAEDARNCT